MIPSPIAIFGKEPGGGAQQYLNRMSSTNATLRTHITTLINGLISDGLWAKLDSIQVAQLLENDSLRNLISVSYPSTKQGSPVFAADQGFTTVSTTDFIKSGFIPNSVSNFDNNDMTQFNYRRTSPALVAGREEMGGYDAAASPYHMGIEGSFSVVAKMQAFTSALVPYVNGFHGASRTDASTHHVCAKRTTASRTVASGGWTLPAYEAFVGCGNSGVAFGASPGQYAAWGFGSGMTPSQLLLLEARLQTYFTSRGTAV